LHVACTGEMRNGYKILVRPLGSSKHRWEDSVKLVLKEICCEDVDRFLLDQDWL